MSNVMHRNARIPAGVLIVATTVGLNAIEVLPYAIRFPAPMLNNGFVALAALSVPIALAFLVNATARRSLRYTALAASVVLLIPAILLALLLAVDLGSRDSLQDELVVSPVAYRVYLREPALITSTPFTVLRKEIDVPCRLKFVHTIWQNERYGNARLRQLSSSTIEVSIDGDGFRKEIKL